MIKTLVFSLILMLTVATNVRASDFQDVPKDHWAAEAVSELADAGIVNGYPDNTYRGDKPVTRYELAVALQNLIYFIEQSTLPPVKDEATAVETTSIHWGESAMTYLNSSGYIPSESALLKDGKSAVTHSELSEVLAQVCATIIEKSVPSIQQDNSPTTGQEPVETDQTEAQPAVPAE